MLSKCRISDRPLVLTVLCLGLIFEVMVSRLIPAGVYELCCWCFKLPLGTLLLTMPGLAWRTCVSNKALFITDLAAR